MSLPHKDGGILMDNPISYQEITTVKQPPTTSGTSGLSGAYNYNLDFSYQSPLREEIMGTGFVKGW